MNQLFDPGDDLKIVADGLEAISLRRPGSSASEGVPQALRRTITEREAAASAGRYTRNDVVWYLPLGGVEFVPQLGDQIVSAAGERFTILELRRSAIGSRCVCVCRNLVVAAGLEGWIALQTGTFIVTAAGTRRIAWRDVYVGLPARIQLEREEPLVRDGRRLVLQEFRITIGEHVALTERMRAVDPDARTYDVTGLESPTRIDQLPTLLANRIRHV